MNGTYLAIDISILQEDWGGLTVSKFDVKNPGEATILPGRMILVLWLVIPFTSDYNLTNQFLSGMILQPR